jgi:hypothetical protein
MARALVPDDLWAAIEPVLPPARPKPKGGRPPIPNRAALAGIAAANQVAQQHGFARHEPAHLVEADDRAAEPRDVLACRDAFLPFTAAEVVIGDVPAIGQVGREQILEGRAEEVGGCIVAERVANVLRRDACARAGFGAMALD